MLGGGRGGAATPEPPPMRHLSPMPVDNLTSEWKFAIGQLSHSELFLWVISCL